MQTDTYANVRLVYMSPILDFCRCLRFLADLLPIASVLLGLEHFVYIYNCVDLKHHVKILKSEFFTIILMMKVAVAII